MTRNRLGNVSADKALLLLRDVSQVFQNFSLFFLKSVSFAAN